MDDIKHIPVYDPVNDTGSTFYGEELNEDPQVVDNIINKNDIDNSNEQDLQELIDQANKDAQEDR